MKKFDIVIPLASNDIRMLKFSIPLIRKNISESNNIYIITTENNFDKIKEITNECILLNEENLYKDLNLNNIKELTYNIFNDHNGGNWYFQQFLKMYFSYITDKEYYLILDGDTLPKVKIDFFDNDNHILFNPKTENHHPYFETIEKLLNIKKTWDFSFISEHMMIKTSIMKELIEKCLGFENIFKVIHTNSRLDIFQQFSEYETYGSYVYTKYKDLYKPRNLKTLRIPYKGDIPDDYFINLNYDLITLE